MIERARHVLEESSDLIFCGAERQENRVRTQVFVSAVPSARFCGDDARRNRAKRAPAPGGQESARSGER